jgi:hypothetical protein
VSVEYDDVERVATAKQIRFLQDLRPSFYIDHARALDANLTEFKGRLNDWVMGRDCYVWMTNDGLMLANAAKEFDTHTNDPGKVVIVVSHQVMTWDRDAVGIHLAGDVLEQRWTGFFTVANTMGAVPEMRRWCLDQIKEIAS